MPIRGETIGTAYVRVLADGSALDKDLERQMEGAGHKGGKSFNDAWTEELKKGLDAQEKLRLGHEKQLQKKLADQNRGFHSQLTKTSKVIGRILHDSEDWVRLTANVRDNMADLQYTLRGGLAVMQDWGREIDDFETAWDRIRNKGRAVGFNIGVGFAIANQRAMGFRETLIDLGDRFEDLGDKVGRSFGRGARNNFVNLIGVIMGRIAQLPGLLADAGSGIINFGNTVLTTFGDAGGGISGFGAVFTSLAPKFIAAGVGITALAAIVGTLTSALMLASGAVIALASSLSFALIGALGLVAGAMVPLVAGIGVAVAGFASMDKAAKDSFKGVTDAFKGLGDTAADTMFKDIGDSAQQLEGVIKSLNPLVEALAGAVRDVFDGWIEGMQSPEFKAFVDNLTTTLPDMVRSLGEIAGNVGQGLANIWIVASPFVQEFLGWLSGVTNEFANLSTMEEGKLDTFFDGVAESVRAVSEFLGSAVDLIGEFFSKGKGTGDQIFRDIADAIDGWVEKLRENPDILENFFRDARKFAGALGNVVEGAAELIDTLDSPKTREFAITLTKGIGDGLKLLADLLGPVIKLLNSMDTSVSNVAIAMGLFAAAFPGVTGKIVGLTQNVTTLGRSLDDNSSKFTRFKANVQGIAGVAGIGLLTTGFIDATKEGNSFSNTLQNVAGGAGIGAMFGPMGALIGAGAGLGLSAVAAGFADTADEARKANLEMQQAQGFEDAKSDADKLAESLNGVVNAYGDVARETVKASFKDSTGKWEKDIDLLRDWGISMDTITSATLGQGDALKIVETQFDNTISVQTTAMERSKAAFEDAKDGVIEYTDEFGHLQRMYLDKEGIDGYQKSFEQAQKDLDETTLAQKRFHDRVEENGATLDAHATKVKNLATQLGLTVRQYKQWPKDVRTRFEAEGLPQTATDALRLIKTFKDLQNFKSIKALISAPGVDATRKQIEQLAEKYKLTPKQIQTLLKLEGITKANADLDGIKKKANDVDSLSPTVPIHVDTSQANTDINNLQYNINNIEGKTVQIHTNFTSSGRNPNNLAAGGIFTGPTSATIGEAGPEAVVPLNRSLSQVDPAVRQLSAIAQGLTTTAAGLDVRSNTPAARPIELTVVTPTEDPFAVAQEVMNRLVAVGY